MTFSEQAWDSIAPIYGAILDHPFIQELGAGTLTAEQFQFYITQDALYLGDFSTALGLIAAGAPNAEMARQFDESARNALIVEEALHESYLRDFAADGDGIRQKSPTCFTYTNFLLSTAHARPLEVAVTAVLPCFWIYWEVGKHIQGVAAPGNPYQRWIDTYGDETFGSRVRNVIALADTMATKAAPEIRDEMLSVFHKASQLEWMFWDSAYRRESWPVS